MGDTTTMTPTDEELTGGLLLALTTKEGRQDPYPAYAAIREAKALHHLGALGGDVAPHVTVRYDLCNQLLRDNRFGRPDDVDQARWEYFGLTEAEWHERFPRAGDIGESMLGANPPDHTRLRGLVAKAFTPKTVEQMKPHIGDLTDELLDQMSGRVDVMSALALKLPITVISEMLGVPRTDHDMLTPHIQVAVQGLANFEPDLERFERIYKANHVVGDYFVELIESKRSHPAEDMLTQLIHVEEEGDKLTAAELVSTVILLFVAGYETTTNLIGNGLRALLLHPDQLAALRADRANLLKPAIEEILRYDSPVQATSRTALEDGLEVDGTPIAKGTEILTILGGANRDPRTYGDTAEAFDISRPNPAPPISFSAGIHYCLGAALARAEGHIVFDRLLDRFPTIEPAWADDEPPVYRDNAILRGLESLPVEVRSS
jgi:cytochrome P450